MDQVILYRDDWHRIVARQRAIYEVYSDIERYEDRHQLELVTSIAESLREDQEFELLAMYYDAIGNYELRDEYIELAIQKDPRDQTICYFRCLQEKPELIPDEVIERELARYTKNKDWLQRARFYQGLGKYREAVADYIRGIGESLEENRVFTAAFYLKELVEEGLIQELFVLALKQAAEEGDLWWQVRALEELEWQKELYDLALRNAKGIEESSDPTLCVLLAEARGDKQQAVELRKAIARGMSLSYITTGEVVTSNNDNGASTSGHGGA